MNWLTWLKQALCGHRKDWRCHTNGNKECAECGKVMSNG